MERGESVKVCLPLNANRGIQETSRDTVPPPNMASVSNPSRMARHSTDGNLPFPVIVYDMSDFLPSIYLVSAQSVTSAQPIARFPGYIRTLFYHS